MAGSARRVRHDKPRPSAVNKTLPAFAAERRAVTPLLLSAGARYRSTSRARGRSAANPPHTAAAVDRWDRRTDGRTLDRFIDPAPHTTRAGSIIHAVRKWALHSQSEHDTGTTRYDTQMHDSIGQQVSAVVNGPARCAASRASCCIRSV